MTASLTGAMARAYRDPRTATERLIGSGMGEPRASFHLIVACLLLFLASLPDATRRAGDLGIEDPLSGAIAAHLFGYFFVAPLLFYAAAAAAHLAARAFGGSGSFLSARTAVFWAALLAGPIAIALSLFRVAAEATTAGALLPLLSYLGYAGLAFWLWLLAAGLAEAEGFGPTLPVAAVVVGAFLAVALVVSVLAGGPAAAG